MGKCKKTLTMMCGICIFASVNAYAVNMDKKSNDDLVKVEIGKPIEADPILNLSSLKSNDETDITAIKAVNKSSEPVVKEDVKSIDKIATLKPVEAVIVESETPTQVSANTSIIDVKNSHANNQSTENVSRKSEVDFLNVTIQDKDLYINPEDGLIYFKLKKGSLKKNINRLLSCTNNDSVVFNISSHHENFSNIWIKGKSVLFILDDLLRNYSEPHPVRARVYENRVVEIYYDKKNRG